MTSIDDGNLASSSLSSPSVGPSPDWPIIPPRRYSLTRRLSSRKMGGSSRDLTANTRPRYHKRASTIAGFFSRILPSGRSEHGGTRRAKDATRDTEPGVNPNELRDWNLARDKPQGQATPVTVAGDSSHRRVWTWSPQKGESKFVENLPRDILYRGQGQNPSTSDHESSLPPPPPPKALARRSQVLNRAEVQELLKSKEEARRNRRNLKDSGDWLGVQGADPYTGEFPVLTPTDTMSSGTTTPSTRSRLARLARKKKAARREYEHIQSLEEEEKDKAKKNKEQAKLIKIDRVKEDLRRQAQYAKWSQHKRQWSSAASPNLSPIAQSLSSVALGSNHEEPATTTIPNFSRPSRHSTGTRVHQSELVEHHESEIVLPKRHQHRLNRSSDTIIHTSVAETGVQQHIPIVDTANERPVVQQHLPIIDTGTEPPVVPPEVEDPGPTRTKTQKSPGSQRIQKPFLWSRRRRATDPGDLAGDQTTGPITPATESNLMSSSRDYLSMSDHFGDLSIPDYHLHLISPESVATRDNQTGTPDSFPLRTRHRNHLEVADEGMMVVTPDMNLPGHQREDNQYHNQYTSEATAISSPSKPRRTRKRPLTPPGLDASQPATAQTTTEDATATEYHYQSPPGSSNESSHHCNDLSGDTLGSSSQSEQQVLLLDHRDQMFNKWEGHVLRHIRSRIDAVQSEFASIHTTTTTGSDPPDPDPPSLQQAQQQVQHVYHVVPQPPSSPPPPPPEAPLQMREESASPRIIGQLDGAMDDDDNNNISSISSINNDPDPAPAPAPASDPDPPATPTPWTRRESAASCIALALTPGATSTTAGSSRPTTPPQSGSLRSAPCPGTAESEITWAHHATTTTTTTTPEERRPTRVSTPTTPRLLCHLGLVNADAKSGIMDEDMHRDREQPAVVVQQPAVVVEQTEVVAIENVPPQPPRPPPSPPKLRPAEVIKKEVVSMQPQGTGTTPQAPRYPTYVVHQPTHPHPRSHQHHHHQQDSIKRPIPIPIPIPVPKQQTQSPPNPSPQPQEEPTHPPPPPPPPRLSLSPEEQAKQKEAMVQEAARIAMMRSRAKAIVKRKRAARQQQQHQPPRGPSSPVTATAEAAAEHKAVAGVDRFPADRPPPTVTVTVTKTKTAEELMPSLRRGKAEAVTVLSGGRDDGDTGGLSSDHGGKNDDKGQRNGSGDDDDAVTTLARHCQALYFLFLGLLYAWWRVAAPAFDQRSELWRRRRRRRSSWRDVAVFAAAGAGVLLGALVGWYVLRLAWWAAEVVQY
ncbi:hypothetical protein F5B20DRAFT_577212 [Whalleya microplaca]|nr:hypothetical protein F5B20DRAFT_577212 [Whalleya microplaca]